MINFHFYQFVTRNIIINVQSKKQFKPLQTSQSLSFVMASWLASQATALAEYLLRQILAIRNHRVRVCGDSVRNVQIIQILKSLTQAKIKATFGLCSQLHFDCMKQLSEPSIFHKGHIVSCRWYYNATASIGISLYLLNIFSILLLSNHFNFLKFYRKMHWAFHLTKVKFSALTSHFFTLKSLK